MSRKENLPLYQEIPSSEDGTVAKKYSFIAGTKSMLIDGPLNILLVCVPIGMVSYFIDWPDGVTFIFSLLALAPLAERLGFVTEQLAIHTNETIGGLLNATFGNATELIVSISALSKGLYGLVKLSLLGSILSNMLLVLGTAFFCGGMRFKTQNFGQIASQINSTLLLLSTMGILFPTALTLSKQDTHISGLLLSRVSSVVLLLIYLAYLYFQLVSHKELFESSDADKVELKDEGVTNTAMTRLPSTDSAGRPRSLKRRRSLQRILSEDKMIDDDEEEEDVLGMTYALFWLAIIAVLIAVLSDALSDTIENAAKSVRISGIFLAAIVLPIVGNAAEHAGAVMFAMKGKLDLSLGVAVGSSTQIALLVLPLLVVLGWIMNKDMDLSFGAFESTTVFLAVLVVGFAIKDGSSNWLIGLCLVASYILVAVGFAAHNEQTLE